MNKPVFLVSNDDGFRARGVHELTKLLSGYGDVIAVCPQGPQSGKSMALTANEPLRLVQIFDYVENEPNVKWYYVNGTPTDCVKLAMHTLFKGEAHPDMVCTGINHGSNASVNVMYSGTMGAAMEGCACGIPSVGFSLCDHSPEADFSPMLPFVKKIVETILKEGLPESICLNVNAPKGIIPKGMKQTVGCKGHWSDEYAEYIDPHGHPYYWLTGKFINEEPENPDTDDALLSAGYVTVVPCALDRTAILPDLFS